MHRVRSNAISLRTILATSAGLCLSSLLAAGEAHAQSAQIKPVGLEEVVVTAQRREERLQDVPVSVTALSTAQLEQKHITDVMSLPAAVPNFSAKPTFSPLEITATIRGVTQLIPAINTDPSIATYVDDTYYAINAGSNAAMVDIERVEVLKGPQGTLFGRNTIGGALNITHHEPTDSFEGYAKVDIANYDQQTYEAVVNVPVVPGVLDTRFVYQYLDRHDGYGTNLFLGNKTGTINQYYFRGAAAWHPNDSWKALLSGYISRSGGNSPGSRLGYVPPGDTVGLFLLGQSRESFLNPPGQDSITNIRDLFRLNQYGGALTITGDLGDGVNIKSISTYRHVDYTTATDTDGTPFAFVETRDFPINTNQYTQELQLYGKAFDDRLNWIVGAYYFDMTGSQVYNTAFTAFLPLPALLAQGSTGTKNTSYAGFAQVTYAVTDKLRATGGVRYTHDKRHVDFRDHAELGVDGPFLACLLPNAPLATTAAACSEPATTSFHYLPYTVGLDYKPVENTLLYAKLSKGYRSGAYNLNALGPDPNPAINALHIAANTNAVSPESLISPEVGFKIEMLDNRLRINGAAYYSRYKNIQISTNVVINNVGNTILTNTGAADIWGGELEVTALLGNLQINGGLGITKPKYDVRPNSECLPAPSCVSGHDYGAGFGTDFINSPHVSWLIGANYPVETPVGKLTFSANYSHQSKTGFYAHDPVASPLVPASADISEAHGLLDGSITMDLTNRPITLTLWVKNLNNAKYHVAGFELGSFNFVVDWLAPPRTFGGSIQYNF